MRNDVRNLILLLPAFALAAHAETYPIVPGRDGGSSVRFVSKAPMESFDGVTHDVTIPAQVRYLPASDELRGQGITGDLIRAQAAFTVMLPDYSVSVGPLVRLKVSDTITVNVTIRLTSG